MRVAYFDAACGASGDMVLGALVDAGWSLDALRDGLAALPVGGYELSAERVRSHGVGATRVNVKLTETPQPERHLGDILAILAASGLSEGVKERAGRVFTRLAEAEARVHDTSVERVHFHEVGAVDAIVDVVGGVMGLEQLGVERVYSSPLPVSQGWATAAHGRMPVPAWATYELLRGAATRALPVDGEVLTPTGAALLTTLAESYGPPAMTPTTIGYGAGTKDFGIANVLRLVVGETASEANQVVLVEANLDDMNPEWFEPALEKLFGAGALDVTLSPLQMKKGRPGVLLKVVCEPRDRETLVGVVLRETTSLGVRWYFAERECLAREWLEVDTAFGRARVKIGRRAGVVCNIAPEHDSCRSIARQSGAPLPAIYAAAREAARVSLAHAGHLESGNKAT
ncbi:MAG: nickel pincer cofactor biosynthesis protein LarC [Armatimonadetes bacterium]|nr:nickel pincer cofactor biosynthesis protein LarC [Armatimonadota bacterium]